MKAIALYYPGHEIPQDWLRAFLLFHDGVARVVPSDHAYHDDLDLLQFRDEFPDAILDVPSSQELTELDEYQLGLFDKAFCEVRARTGLPPDHYSLKVHFGEHSSEIVDYAGLHRSKVSQGQLVLLHKHDLTDPVHQVVLEDILRRSVDDFVPTDWICVRREAADLILSGLANKVARKHGYGAVTSRPLDYSLVALNNLGIGPFSGSLPGPTAAKVLASAVISALIPHTIGDIPIQTYADLRREFLDVREPFDNLVRQANAASELTGIADAETLAQSVTQAAKQLSDQIETIKNRRASSRLQQWTPFVLVSLITLVSVMPLDYRLALALAGATVAVGAIEKVTTRSDQLDDQAVRVAGAVASIRREIANEVETSVNALL